MFVLRVCFQFVHSSEKFLHGLWSFSLKCARRLSQTRTLPKDFLQKPRPAVESPGSLSDATLEWHRVSALWEVLCHSQPARRGRKALAPSGRRQAREHLSLSWNVWIKDAGPLPVWTRNCRSHTDGLAKIPASMESAELAMGLALYKGWLPKHWGSSVVNVLGCASTSGLYRAQLSTLQHEKMPWCYCWWPPTFVVSFLPPAADRYTSFPTWNRVFLSWSLLSFSAWYFGPWVLFLLGRNSSTSCLFGERTDI